MTGWRLAITGLCLCLGIPAISAGATLPVPSPAYPTIQAGLDSAAAGDTVAVAAGTYTGNLEIVRRVVLRGANSGTDARTARGPESVLDAAGSGAALEIYADSVTVDGFTITRAQGGALGAGVWLDSTRTGTQVLGNIFRDNSVGACASSAGPTLFQLNLFDGNNRPGPHSGEGIWSGASRSLTVDQNEFKNHATAALECAFAQLALHQGAVFTANSIHDNVDGMRLGAITNATVGRNDFVSNTGVCMQIGGGCSGIRIRNNHVFSNWAGIHVEDQGLGAGNNSDITVVVNSISGDTYYGLYVESGFMGQLQAHDNWWGSATGPKGSGTGIGDAVLIDVGMDADFSGWRLSGADTDPAIGWQPEPDNPVSVPQLPANICLSTARPCLTLPVSIHRSDNAAMRGFSVTFQLSANLALCGDIASSVQEFTYLFAGGTTIFEAVDNGGGSYTADCIILGTPCGSTLPNGTLFTIAVRSNGPDGAGSITLTDVQLRNCLNDTIATSFGTPSLLPIDNTVPAAIADLAAATVKSGNDASGRAQVRLTWSGVESGATVRVYRAPFGNYPYYDNAPGAGSVPAAPAYPPPSSWQLTSVTASGQTDLPATRDSWYYVAFVTDACGNRSAVSTLAGGTLDYFLGDVTNGLVAGTGDNQVNLADVTYLGAHYGATLGGSDPLSVLDVGPTTDGTVDGRPLTDNSLDFEDLMIFVLNYKAVSAPVGRRAPRAAASASDQIAVSVTGGEEPGAALLASLELQGSGWVQGLSAGLRWNPAVVEPVGTRAGDWLTQQGGVAFPPSPGAVDCALLGPRGTQGMAGQGTVAEISFRRIAAGDPGIALDRYQARDSRNRRLELTPAPVAPAAPGATSLAPPVPNPSRGGTLLAFSLASPADVDLSIYSVDGRRVRALERGAREAGAHRSAWDGLDDHGRRAAPGVYFARLRAGAATFTRTLTVLP